MTINPAPCSAWTPRLAARRKTAADEILGTDAQHRKSQQLLCQEYVLQSNRVYHIRPKDDKHPSLLPIGETAQFLIHKDKLILRVPEADGKEREYLVVSMTPREETEVHSPINKTLRILLLPDPARAVRFPLTQNLQQASTRRPFRKRASFADTKVPLWNLAALRVESWPRESWLGTQRFAGGDD